MTPSVEETRKWLARVPDGAIFTMPGAGGVREGALVVTKAEVQFYAAEIERLTSLLSKPPSDEECQEQARLEFPATDPGALGLAFREVFVRGAAWAIRRGAK